MNAIGADSAASLSLVSKAANSLPNFGSQSLTLFGNSNREGTESHPVIKSRGPNWQFFVVLVMLPV